MERDPFTGRVADHDHHPTGRGPDGNYFDPLLVVPLSHKQHMTEHVVWRAFDLEDDQLPALKLRLLRAGNLLVRLGEYHDGGVVYLPARTVLGYGRLLQSIASEVAG